MGLRYDERGDLQSMSDREVVRTAKRWLIVGLVAMVALPAVIWGGSVAISGIRGRGEQIKQINRAENRTFAQEQFRQLMADVQTYDIQLGQARSTAEVHRSANANRQDNAIGTIATEQARLDSVVLGLQNQCVSTRNQYNAEATKISKRQFLEADLPPELNSTDPATDCN